MEETTEILKLLSEIKGALSSNSSIAIALISAGAALIGALGGVLLTNKSNNKRILVELEHDATQRDREREMDLRKDVYLKIAEEMTVAQQFLAGLPQVDFTKIDSSQFLKGFFIASSKIHIVGKYDTVEAVSITMKYFTSSFMKLMSLIIPLQNIKSDIDIATDMINKHSASSDHILSEMTNKNIDGSMDKRTMTVLQTNSKYHQGEIAKLTEERDNNWSSYNKSLRHYQVECMKESIEISKLSINALLLIRQELEMEIDKEKYKKLMDSNLKELEGTLHSFIKSLEDMNEA